jgi:general secretion pathway protein A
VYEAYFGLAERPFDLSPNPRFLFLSRRHNEALTNLRYGLSGKPGLTLIVGDAGTGKTTLVRAALQATTNGSNGHRVLHLSNPTLTRAEFYEYLATGFGFGVEAAQSKTRFLKQLEMTLETAGNDQPPVAVLVDEAQSLPHELLEEIRLLTNLQAGTGQSLMVALLGQPELAERLNEERLRQLKQRISLRCELGPLDLQETAAYIATRIRVAGGRPELIFTRDAISMIFEHSNGIPRTVNVICDNALIAGFATDSRPVGADMILEVCRDFHLDRHVIAAPRTSVQSRQRSTQGAAVATMPSAAVAAPVRQATKASMATATVERKAEGSVGKSLSSAFEGRRRRFFFF